MKLFRTYKGTKFDFENPTVDMIDIEDIAQALSHECRFGGHLTAFYSVAEHSEMCSRLASHPNKLEALLHDASEAYCKDIPSPLKYLLPDYLEIEKRVDAVIRKKFKLPSQMSDEVSFIDAKMLEWEKCMLTLGNDVPNKGFESDLRVNPRLDWTPADPPNACRQFLYAFKNYS